jgi:hypothetical protein
MKHGHSKCIYAISNVKENDEVVFTGTIEEVANYLDKSRNYIYTAVSRKTKVKTKYNVFNIGPKDELDK